MNLKTIEERLAADHNLPAGFIFFKWECFPQPGPTLYVEFSGGLCPLLTRGKRKGRPNYRKATERQTFVVSVAHSELWESEYEEKTGKCRQCRGKGMELVSINFVKGITSHRECSRCRGTGRRADLDKCQEALG